MEKQSLTTRLLQLLAKHWLMFLGTAAFVLTATFALSVRSKAPLGSDGFLEASGRIEGDLAAVGAKVGGRVVRLPVEEGQALRAGQLIAQVSSSQATAALGVADHQLHTAKEERDEAVGRVETLRLQVKTSDTAVKLAQQESEARIGEAEAGLDTARARLSEAAAERELKAEDRQRYETLFRKDEISAREFDQVKTASQTAQAAEQAAQKQVLQAQEGLRLARTGKITTEMRNQQLEEAKQALKEAQSAAEAAHAREQVAEASRELAEANLDDTRIVAPFAGTVLRKLAEEGEVVAPGAPLVTFVDLSKLYVKVYLTESKIGKIKLGDPARVYVDAFPNRWFPASVSDARRRVLRT